MTRKDFQQLARQRLKEAQYLLKKRCWGSAYYLAGFAIECALKASIARKTRRYEFPDKKVVNESYKHDLTDLVKTAGLETARQSKAQASPAFAQNWAVVKDWDNDSRYKNANRQNAQALLTAIAGPPDGVLQWIEQHW